MISTSVPMISVVVTIILCNKLCGNYGVAIAAVGMLCTLGITLATDAYGPVADNAGGLAEMAGLEPFVRNRTDKLDSLGNTTAATGKGLAIGSALLTAVGLIAAFVEQSMPDIAIGACNPALVPYDPNCVSVRSVQLQDPTVLAGILIGAGVPFVFGALTMLSVDRGARAIITEVRLQFAMAPELMKGAKSQVVDGVTYPDSTRCVRIATEAAIQEMVLPGMLAVFTPIIMGFLLGPRGLTGVLGGSLAVCFMLALMMANAGGAWDNSKKWCEKCGEEGEPKEGSKTAKVFTRFGIKKAAYFDELLATHGYEAMYKDPKEAATTPARTNPAAREALKESLLKLYKDRHSSTVVGDTLGDPFKDTSGPALNVLSKTMTMVSLMVRAPHAPARSPCTACPLPFLLLLLLLPCSRTPTRPRLFVSLNSLSLLRRWRPSTAAWVLPPLMVTPFTMASPSGAASLPSSSPSSSVPWHTTSATCLTR